MNCAVAQNINIGDYIMKKRTYKLCGHCATNEEYSEQSSQVDAENNDDTTAVSFDINEYQEILEHQNRIIHINYEIDEDIYGLVARKIHLYNLEDELENVDVDKRIPIKIHIHSIGGSLFDGLTVVNAINSSKTPVYTYAENLVASMAFMLYLAGHKRFARRFNDFMYHDVSYGIDGTATDIRRGSDHIIKLRDLCDQFIVERTKITKDQLEDVLNQNKDWHFFSDEALELGVCHEII